MTTVDFLMERYFADKPEATKESVGRLVDTFKDRTITVKVGDEISLVAMFMTLTDETFKNLDKYPTNNEAMLDLLCERGNNILFFLVAGKSIKAIRQGIQQARQYNPRTISWLDPDDVVWHRYRMN